MLWSIPARAGEPIPRQPAPRQSEVYPRACGGNRQSNLVQRSITRSIPARAGEPSLMRTIETNCGVYPRACGGTSPLGASMKPGIGLSPRVRGNPCSWIPEIPTFRSIPARAGEPGATRRTCADGWVYPRACGGTVPSSIQSTIPFGLSPRVRGNRKSGAAPITRDGSIPARAGEPACSKSANSGRKVYPRACGGTEDLANKSPEEAGLSPRVRGNLRSQCRSHDGSGSIPARAGEPPSRYSTVKPVGVYPRACGGTSVPSCCTGLG